MATIFLPGVKAVSLFQNAVVVRGNAGRIQSAVPRKIFNNVSKRALAQAVPLNFVDPLDLHLEATVQAPLSYVQAEFATGNAGEAPKPPLSVRLQKFWQTHQITIAVVFAATAVIAIVGR